MVQLKSLQTLCKVVLFGFSAFLLASCSMMSNRSGSSVCVWLSSGAYNKICSRNADNGGSEKRYSIEVNLKGEYKESKSAEISVDGAEIIFENIPEGSTVYAEAVVYEKSDSEKIPLYTGKTEEIQIVEGENELVLAMKWTLIGKKARPTAVGDIVFSDGSAVAYSEGLELTDAQKSEAVAVIFYVGTSSDVLGAKKLGVGLKSESNVHLEPGINIPAILCQKSTTEPSEPYFKPVRSSEEYYITGDFDGSDNWSKICEVDTDANSKLDLEYEFFGWLKDNYPDGWYIPSIVELCLINDNKTSVNNSLALLGGFQFGSGSNILSSSLSGEYSEYYVWGFNFYSDGSIDTGDGDGRTCAVREF